MASGGRIDGVCRGFLLAPGLILEGAVGPHPRDLRSERRKIIDERNRFGQAAAGVVLEWKDGNGRLWLRLSRGF